MTTAAYPASSRFRSSSTRNISEEPPAMRMNHPILPCVVAGLMAVLLAGCATGTGDPVQQHVQQHAGPSLGTVAFPVTCSQQAQLEFNRAVALLHHMTYPQARE